MLGIFAESLLLATRMEPRSSREQLARLQREDEDYILQGRRARPEPRTER